MGSDAHVIVEGPGHLAEVARARIDELEHLWSRFRPDSEVSRLNEAGGAPVSVSADTSLLVRRGIEAWRITGGFVDCTLLDQVVAAGYDRTFADLVPGPATAPPPRSLVGPGDITVDGTTVQLPAGLGFDPGGIGKGLAADLVADEVMEAGAEGVCINLGGDLRVRGQAPQHGAWTVSVDHPASDRPLVLLGLADGAVATSTTLRRRWMAGDELRHHLIDPHTGQPSTTDLALVAVVAESAWLAEVLAKGVLLRGGDHPFDLLGGTGAEALVVDRHGNVTVSAGLPAFLGTQPVPDRVPLDDHEGAR